MTHVKDYLLIFSFLAIAILLFSLRNSEKDVKGYETTVSKLFYLTDSLKREIGALEVEKDSIAKREAHALARYKQLPPRERIKLITKIDPYMIPIDTGAILSMYGVDSINSLAIGYKHCKEELAVSDSIINLQGLVIKSDSVIISTQQKMIAEAKKENKKNFFLGTIIGFVVGLIF